MLGRKILCYFLINLCFLTCGSLLANCETFATDLGDKIDSTSGQIYNQAVKSVVYFQGYGFNPDDKFIRGTGFIIRGDGLVITNCHVLAASSYVLAELNDGKRVPIDSIIFYDTKKDVFILKVNDNDLLALQLSDSDKVNIGDPILTIGNPGGKRNILSEGKVVGIRNIGGSRYFEISATVSPGNSGGPVINSDGSVIGISTAQMSKGMALAINEITPFIDHEPKLSWAEFIQVDAIKGLGLFSKGAEAYAEHNSQKAIDDFTEAIQLSPENSMFYFNLAQVYWDIGKLDKAIINYEASLKLDPELLEANVDLSVAYGNNGNYEKAIYYAEKAIEIDPNTPQAYSNLIYFYKKIGNEEKAAYYGMKLRALERLPYGSRSP